MIFWKGVTGGEGWREERREEYFSFQIWEVLFRKARSGWEDLTEYTHDFESDITVS